LKHSVPPFELPKITSFVSGIFMPMASASPLWSITAKSVMPRMTRRDLILLTASSTVQSAVLVMMPSAELIFSSRKVASVE
jgi:hypothetical protein